jgi:hypothetical protein
MGSLRPRNSTRAGKAHLPANRSGRTPGSFLESMKTRSAEGPVRRRGGESSDAIGDPMALKDGTPGDTLRRIRASLEVAKSAAYVSSIALTAQAADADPDVAILLRRSVADEIGRQVERIDGLLGEVAL